MTDPAKFAKDTSGYLGDDGKVVSHYLQRKYGKYRCGDGLYDIEGTVSFTLRSQFMPRALKEPRHRDGVGFSPKSCRRYVVMCAWAVQTEGGIMNVLEQLEGNYEAAESLWNRYVDRLKDFRAVIKNDVSSLDAAARKSTEATNKMLAAYGHVIDKLNSNEMATAIDNAERLAAAMQALAKLESHRLVLSVTEQDRVP